MDITYSSQLDIQSIITVYCDEIPYRDVHKVIFGRKPSFPKTCHSFEEFKEQFALFEYQQAKNYALRRLSIQPMLSMALSRSLKERLVSEETIDKIIQEFIELKFLNDEEWTASFVRTQSQRKAGPRAIAQKLASKGIRGSQLEEALEGEWDLEKQKSLISALLEKRYAKRNLDDYKERQKVIASLMRKGFDFSAILETMRS